MKNIIQASVVSLLLSVPAFKLHAEDPLKVAPSMYSLVFENDRVRVMQLVFNPGEKIAQHSHPDHYVYVLEGGKLKISKPDGTSIEPMLEAGQVIWIPAESHWAQNTGSTQVKLLVNELKNTRKAPMSK